MAKLRIEVVRALPQRQVLVALELEVGATVRTALAAAGLSEVHAVGIYGRRATLDTRLADGDRVEVYRPLQAEPQAARRRRALSRRR